MEWCSTIPERSPVAGVHTNNGSLRNKADTGSGLTVIGKETKLHVSQNFIKRKFSCLAIVCTQAYKCIEDFC